MKFCQKCGRSCSEQARFCMNCGYSFDAHSAPLQPQVPAQPPLASPVYQPTPTPRPAAQPVPYPAAAQRPIAPELHQPIPQQPQQPMPPKIDLSQTETATSDQYALHRNDDYDPTATSTTFSGYRFPQAPDAAAEHTDWNTATPGMHRGLWHGLLFGSIGLAVITLIAAIMYYYSNLWI